MSLTNEEVAKLKELKTELDWIHFEYRRILESALARDLADRQKRAVEWYNNIKKASNIAKKLGGTKNE